MINLKEWLSKRILKHKLMYTFEKAGIFMSHNNIRIYPMIRDINKQDGNIRYTFTLPVGVNPKVIEDKFYCFKQVFGRNLEVSGDVKLFKLVVYNSDSDLKSYNYRYKDYVSSLSKYKIPIVLGNDRNGERVIYDMTDSNTPHLLIAGETGSGKSSMVRVVLSTLIQYMPPEKLELYLGDLKNSEFHFLRRVKHVKQVCMDESEMQSMLSKVWTEVLERRKLMEKYEIDHIDQCEEKKPYILVAIDEVGMLQGDKETMKLIEKISAVGRALGVFLMLSMQRPDAKVLDGKLKLNMTVRAGFKCDSAINSNIIGTPGSESLSNSGRMILKLNGLKQVQAPYLELEKAKKIVEPYRLSKESLQTVQIDSEATSNPFQVLDYENER